MPWTVTLKLGMGTFHALAPFEEGFLERPVGMGELGLVGLQRLV